MRLCSTTTNLWGIGGGGTDFGVPPPTSGGPPWMGGGSFLRGGVSLIVAHADGQDGFGEGEFQHQFVFGVLAGIVPNQHWGGGQ